MAAKRPMQNIKLNSFEDIFEKEKESEKDVKMHEYYYGNEGQQFNFIRIPKVFFTQAFDNISYGAKILYGLLLDRMNLSIKNHWLDESQRVFICFKLDDIQKELHICKTKAISLLNELEKQDLIERKRQQNVAARIYVKNIICAYERKVQNSEVQSLEVQNMKVQNSEVQGLEVQNMEVQNPEIQNMEVQKPEVQNSEVQKPEVQNMEVQILNQNNKKQEDKNNLSSSSCFNYREIEQTKHRFRKQTGYDVLKEKHNFKALDDLYDLIADDMRLLYFHANEKVTISGKSIPAKEMLNLYERLDKDQIEYIIINGFKEPIKNIRAYVRTCVYSLCSLQNLYFMSNSQNKNQFNEFQKNNYDFELLEKELLSNGN